VSAASATFAAGGEGPEPDEIGTEAMAREASRSSS